MLVVDQDFGLCLFIDDLIVFIGMMQVVVEDYVIVDVLILELLLVCYLCVFGYYFVFEDNLFNVWFVKFCVEGCVGGLLLGLCVVLKDNIMLVGVLMMNGVLSLCGYVLDVDVMLVMCLLDVGVVIEGKV